MSWSWLVAAFLLSRRLLAASRRVTPVFEPFIILACKSTSLAYPTSTGIADTQATPTARGRAPVAGPSLCHSVLQP